MNISIVIATFNRSESLKRTLASINALEMPQGCQAEVLIIDNNSSDNTKGTVQSFENAARVKIYYHLEPRQGKTFALNTALGLALGEVLAFIDDDVILEKNWIEIIDERFKNKSIACLTGRIIPIYEKAKPDWYSDKLSTVLGNVDLSSQASQVDHATGANMAIRKSVLQDAGGFTIHKGLINEDTLLSRKLRDRGANIHYEPSMIVYHYFQPEKFNKAYFKRWYWLSGQTIAEINKDKLGEKALFGVPLWRLRKAIEHAGNLILNMANDKERFYHQLQIYRFLGFCRHRWFGKTQ